jgi:hypothetical protein
MKGLRRIAFLGAAALAGMMGLSGLQSRAIAKANVEQARQSAKAGAPIPDSIPGARVQQERRGYSLRIGGERHQFASEGIWVGYMRGGCSNRAGGTWRVGKRGRSRLGGRS